MKWPVPSLPYKYLAPFEEADHAIFFGRDREIELLLADIVTTRLVVLFAPSGTGKSSLINAGVRPRLRERDYRTAVARVGSDPVGCIREAADVAGLKIPEPTKSLAELLMGIVRAEQRPLVLFLDQFEEFFLNDISEDLRQAFIADVGRLYRTADAGVHLVFSMREDYLAEMDAFRDEIPTIFEKESQLRLRLFTEEQAREAIEGPSKVVEPNFSFEEGLVARIAAELPREHGLIEPVAVQIVCDTLWEERFRWSIRHVSYDSLGGASGIIAARVMKDIDDCLNADEVLLLESAIDLMHTEDWTKRAVSISELRSRLWWSSAGPSFINAMISTTLIRTEWRGSETRIEWVSDYLAALSKKMPGRLRRMWLSKVRQSATPPGLTSDRLDTLLQDGGWDEEELYWLLRSAVRSRDSLGAWRRAVADPWPLIERALGDTWLSDDDAARVILYLGEASGGPPVRILEDQLSKPPRVRTALRALGAIRDPQAIDAIRPFLEQEEWQVAAVDALRTIATPEAIKLADSVQKRGKGLGDFVPFSKASELHGMDEERWEQLLEAMALGEVVGLIGPALLGETMLKRLTTRFEYPFSEPTDVRSVMEYLSINFGSGWQKLLMEEQGDIPPVYRALAMLPIQRWLTADYTDEFERALIQQGKEVQADTPVEFTRLPSSGTAVIHMLGFVGAPSSITETPRVPALVDAIRDSLFQLAPRALVVFGFDRADAEVSIIRWEFGRREFVPTVMIASSPGLANRRQLGRAQEYFQQYSRARGIQFYWGTPEEFVEDFHRHMGPAE